jgi:hypothetical protein
MKETFNIDEEISRVETGNTVLISGLYGKNFKFINNKCGIIKNIYLRNERNELLHLADVKLDEDGTIHAVNLDFIFKLNSNKCVDNIVQHLVSVDNPVLYYVRKKSIKSIMNFYDEVGQYMSLCVDNKGKSHVLLFSGIN